MHATRIMRVHHKVHGKLESKGKFTLVQKYFLNTSGRGWSYGIAAKATASVPASHMG